MPRTLCIVCIVGVRRPNYRAGTAALSEDSAVAIPSIPEVGECSHIHTARYHVLYSQDWMAPIVDSILRGLQAY